MVLGGEMIDYYGDDEAWNGLCPECKHELGDPKHNVICPECGCDIIVDDFGDGCLVMRWMYLEAG